MPNESKLIDKIAVLDELGKPTKKFLDACTSCLLMDQTLRSQQRSQKFVIKTAARLFEFVRVFDMLQVKRPEHLADFVSRLKVINLEDGAKLPLRKRGAFIVLNGEMKLTTHWNNRDGYTDHQQVYQSFIFKHLGRTDSAYDDYFRVKPKSREATAAAKSRRNIKRLEANLIA